MKQKTCMNCIHYYGTAERGVCRESLISVETSEGLIGLYPEINSNNPTCKRFEINFMICEIEEKSKNVELLND